MLNKNTVLFFTETDQTAVADAVRAEFPTDGSVVSVVIEKREVENALFNAVFDKVVGKTSKTRFFLEERYAAKNALRRDGKKKEQMPVVFDRNNSVHRRILNVLNRYNPTVVAVTARTMLNDVIAATEHYGHGVKIAVLCEDYVLDDRVVNKVTDKYFVDNFSMRNELVEEGIPGEKIVVADMPVERQFYTQGSKEDARKKLGLDQKDTLLVVASKRGDERFVSVIKAIRESDLDVNVVVACGKNPVFLNQAREAGAVVFSDTLDMNVALDACDAVVARPTVIVLSQALAKQKRVFSLFPANRSEEENLKYLSLMTVLSVADTEELVRKLQAFYAATEDPSATEEERDLYSARTVAAQLAKLGKKDTLRFDDEPTSPRA